MDSFMSVMKAVPRVVYYSCLAMPDGDTFNSRHDGHPMSSPALGVMNPVVSYVVCVHGGSVHSPLV
jgi:hypothetical protein